MNKKYLGLIKKYSNSFIVLLGMIYLSHELWGWFEGDLLIRIAVTGTISYILVELSEFLYKKVSCFLKSKHIEMSCDENLLKSTSNIKSRFKNILNYRKTPFWFILIAIVVLVVMTLVFITNSEPNEYIKYTSKDNKVVPEFKTIKKKEDTNKINEIISKVYWTKEIAVPMGDSDFSFWTEKEGFKERLFDYDIWFNAQLVVMDPKTNTYGFIADKKDIDFLKQIFLDDTTTEFIYGTNIDTYKFFESLISNETYKLDLFNDSDKINEIFSKYCDYRGLDILLSNRIAFKNYQFFQDNEIKSYVDLEVKLINEDIYENTVFQDYEVSYKYVDKNNKLHEFIDFYTINVIDNKIDYIYYDKNKNIIQPTKTINNQENLQSNSDSNLTINYIENKYQKVFVENKIDLIALPLDDSIILNTIYENTVVNVIDTAEVNNVIWLYVSIHVYDTPSNYKGWIKESDTVLYTKDKISKVQSHVTVKDGEDIFETYNFEDISITEPYKSNNDGGRIEEKKDGFVRIQSAGGKTIWVKEVSIIYPEVD
jgi:hypothetical protein